MNVKCEGWRIDPVLVLAYSNRKAPRRPAGFSYSSEAESLSKCTFPTNTLRRDLGFDRGLSCNKS